jgi:hypothetical protein
MSAPRASKRRRTIAIIPEIEEDAQSEAVLQLSALKDVKQSLSQPRPGASKSPNTQLLGGRRSSPNSSHHKNASAYSNGSDKREGSEESDDSEEEELSPEEEEKHRIWNLFAEDYHDSKHIFALYC